MRFDFELTTNLGGLVTEIVAGAKVDPAKSKTTGTTKSPFVGIEKE